MRTSAGFRRAVNAASQYYPAENTSNSCAIRRDITNLQSKVIVFEWSALSSIPDIESSCMPNDQFHESVFVNPS